MRRIAALAVLAALASADVAVAASHPPAHPRTTAVVRPHKTSLVRHRRRPRQHADLAAAVRAPSQNNALARTYRASADDDGVPTHPGFFKSAREKEAGLGFKDGSTQAVLGVYQRPPEPGIPGPQTYSKPESRGAAGLSLSFKLGQ
jgi:hypothetical protein